MRSASHARLMRFSVNPCKRNKGRPFGHYEDKADMTTACKHTVTQGRQGEKGSWCCDCGVKVYAVHDRPCRECRFFRPEKPWWGGEARTGVCYMRVTADLHVTYKIERGHTPGVEKGLCFEAAPMSASQ